jgi:hypothetical protein
MKSVGKLRNDYPVSCGAVTSASVTVGWACSQHSEVSIMCGTADQKLTLVLLTTITFEAVPFRADAPFPALLPS